jgi:two-component system chemotaxis response regulator CheY
MRALVIDDSRATRTILRNMLTELVLEVKEADNGAVGLERLKEHGRFDVALVDWNMPVMNGFEFIVNVRQDSQYDKMILMMVTTETEPAQMVKALNAGVDEYVMKPFTKDIILDKLKLLGVVGG